MTNKLIVVFGFLMFFLSWNSYATDEVLLYVSVNGSDKNSGSFEKPFATAGKALETIISIKKEKGDVPVKVIFDEGIYYGTKELKLTAEVSGKKESPVILVGANNKKVIFHGGAKLNGNHFQLCKSSKILKRLPEESKGKVWVIDLKKEGITDYGVMRQHGFGTVPGPAPLEIFINGEAQFLARYPNTGILKIGKVYDTGSIPREGDFSKRGAEFGYEYDRIERWKQADEIWIHGKFSHGYNDDHLKIESIDWDKKSIKIAQPHLYGVNSSLYDADGKRMKKPSPFRGYYAYNLLEEIDQPGEYFLDRQTGKLYIYPTTDLANADIEVSLKESPFFSIENASNIRIENIAFNCSRGLGIFMNNSHDITIDHCEFSNLGILAISMGKPYQNNSGDYYLDGSPNLDKPVKGNSYNNTISNCLVYGIGSGGFRIDGGDRKNLIAGNNLVFNCEFYETDRINHTYSPAVKLDGVRNIVRNCYFHDLRHQAISFMGNDHFIEYSRFDKICTDADDSGAIYTGRDPASRGTEIRYNYFSNIEPENKESSMAGVYFDDGSGGMIVRNNFFYKVGNPGHYQSFSAVFFHGGHDNITNNNIFMDCKVALGQTAWDDDRWKEFLKSPLMEERLKNKVDITSEVYQKRYPELKDFFTNIGRRLNPVIQNILIETQLARTGVFSLGGNVSYKNVGDQPDQLDYTAFEELFPGIKPFPFGKCGIINEKN